MNNYKRILVASCWKFYFEMISDLAVCAWGCSAGIMWCWCGELQFCKKLRELRSIDSGDREHWQDPEPGSLFGAVSRLWEPACCELLLFGLQHWVNSTHSRADAVARQRWIRSESEELELCSRDPHWFHINQKRKRPGVFQLHLFLTSFRVSFSMCFFFSSRVQYPPVNVHEKWVFLR